MTHGPDLPAPTARTIQGWWQELADLRPSRLWFGRLLFHRLEACVETSRRHLLDPLQRALLRAIPADDSRLASFDSQLRSRLVSELMDDGLLVAQGAGWDLTPAGRAALVSGSFLRFDRDRQSFWFVDNAAHGKPPQFLPPNRPLESVAAPDDWNFPADALAECVRQPAAWKQRHRFPDDVRAVVAAPSDWRTIMIDRAEQFLGVIVETEEAFSGFSVDSASASLEKHLSAFRVERGGEEVLPDLTEEPLHENWRQAWLEWCQSRGIEEAEVCSLEREGHRLIIKAPQTLVKRLRTAPGEPLKNEAWLLAGTRRFRAALPFDVTE